MTLLVLSAMRTVWTYGKGKEPKPPVPCGASQLKPIVPRSIQPALIRVSCEAVVPSCEPRHQSELAEPPLRGHEKGRVPESACTVRSLLVTPLAPTLSGQLNKRSVVEPACVAKYIVPAAPGSERG